MTNRRQAAKAKSHRSMQASFCSRLAEIESEYLDLGLEYHALPLQLRQAKGEPQSDCAAAFEVRDENPTPDCIGYLSDLRELRTARAPCGGEFHLDNPDAALKTATEILDALTDQLVAIRICVNALHRQFSDMLDEQVDIAEGGEYRLAMSPEDGVEKHELLRKWVLSLPHVCEWFRDGFVQSEAEALLLTACAGGQSRPGLSDAEVRLCDGLDEGYVRRNKLQVDREVGRFGK